MKQYILPVFGAIIVGVGLAWVLTTGVTLAYRGVKGPLALDYRPTEEKIENDIPKKVNPLPPVSSPPVVVTAQAYLVADLKTGEVLLSQRPNSIYPIASITKLMTAVVSLEEINQDNLMTIEAEAIATNGEAGGLILGEKLSVGDLLYPLLLESSNDAAEALAQAYGRASFVARMNDEAKAIGLKRTTFADPSGISSGNRSTAQDLFYFMAYLYQEERTLLTLTKLPQKRNGNHLWLNNNHLVSMAGFLGGKTGKTVVAHQTLVSIIDLPLGDGIDKPVAIILLQSDDRDGDFVTLLNYLQTVLVPRS